NHIRLSHLALRLETQYQTAFAQQVDEPRHTLAVMENRAHCRGSKRQAPLESRSVQALGDVDSRFRFGERTQLRSAGDSLLQSAQFPPVQNGREFGLPTQHDLQNLFLMRVRVSEKADLLKQFGRQQMSFVNDQ